VSRHSGVRASVELASTDAPVIAAMYCFPPTANDTGYPLIEEARLISACSNDRVVGSYEVKAT